MYPYTFVFTACMHKCSVLYVTILNEHKCVMYSYTQCHRYYFCVSTTVADLPSYNRPSFPSSSSSARSPQQHNNNNNSTNSNVRTNPLLAAFDTTDVSMTCNSF